MEKSDQFVLYYCYRALFSLPFLCLYIILFRPAFYSTCLQIAECHNLALPQEASSKLQSHVIPRALKFCLQRSFLELSIETKQEGVKKILTSHSFCELFFQLRLLLYNFIYNHPNFVERWCSGLPKQNEKSTFSALTLNVRLPIRIPPVPVFNPNLSRLPLGQK
jgi:hypothetical protein